MMTISKFPDFSPIRMPLQKEVTSFCRQFDTYSDFSFTNLFAWDTNKRAGLSWLDGNLVIRLPDYLTEGHFIYTILGDHNLDDALSRLFQLTQRLDLVPEFVIKHLEHPEKYAIAEDRASFDYVYSVKDLAYFPGKKYKKKRNIANTTKQLLGDRLTFETFSTVSQSTINEVMHVIEKWGYATKQTEDFYKFESIALQRLFNEVNSLDLCITLCRLDGALNGFTIYEIVDNETSICHFEKSLNTTYPGIGVLLVKEAASNLVGRSRLVNWEQDLGLAGLQKNKRSYAPIRYQKKYWIGSGDGSL